MTTIEKTEPEAKDERSGPSSQRKQYRPRRLTIPGENPPSPLRLARLVRGLKLRHVAERAHVSIGHLSSIERGLKRPRPSTLARIESALAGREAQTRN